MHVPVYSCGAGAHSIRHDHLWRQAQTAIEHSGPMLCVSSVACLAYMAAGVGQVLQLPWRDGCADAALTLCSCKAGH